MNPKQLYKLRHPDRVKASKERWRKAHPEVHAAHSRAWRERNPEKAKQVNDDWAKRNPEYVSYKTRLRRALKRSVKSEFYRRADVYNRDKGICQICGEFIELDLPARDSLAFSIDHIIPLSKGGDDIFSNVRATHYSCNSRRGNRE